MNCHLRHYDQLVRDLAKVLLHQSLIDLNDLTMGLVGLVAELPATVGVTVSSDMLADRVRVIG